MPKEFLPEYKSSMIGKKRNGKSTSQFIHEARMGRAGRRKPLPERHNIILWEE